MQSYIYIYVQSENHSFRYSLVEIAETKNELNSEQAENEVVMSLCTLHT